MAMNKNVIIGIVGLLGFFLVIWAAVYLNKTNLGFWGVASSPVSSGSSKYDSFAKCLAEKGAKMYGAFWCGHCKNQKDAFDSSFRYVNYQECTIDGQQNSFAQVCKDADIKGYPTWKFSDGTKQEGEVSMSDLAKKTGCVLPQQ